MPSDVDVVVIGGGAAGVAAAKRLQQTQLRCLLVEARPRLGGRAWTVHDADGHALDLGCGWLHSADRNPWVGVAQSEGLPIDKTPPPWMNRQLERGFPRAEFADYRKAFTQFYERLHEAALRESDAPASSLLDPASRWNPLMNATSTYISGAELDRISLKDLDRYHSTDVNWRVIEGYGTLISKHGADVPQILDCPVSAIDHSGKRLRVDTGKGAIAADQVIVTVPSAVLAAERIGFTPSLPKKIEAALGLPLGVDDKLFIALDGAEEFETSVRVFGHTDRVATAGYHLRPFGWSIIECYFGGACAAELEQGGLPAFFDFAASELSFVFGSAFARRIKPLRVHGWHSDPFALGAYSYAMPGKADCRAALAEPVDNRLFFAGEASSLHEFSTAHGGYLTGVAAAEQVIAARKS
ncbi:MAG TPA: NAD(P)/FAD-dependent oxidoreductase [Xanthobacteraceae bacterium]|jgi:monoamine oxidase|nr:NAD(P)/FAD-dependent oxidoreductase [Xanthobacteraceae bacterium]